MQPEKNQKGLTAISIMVLLVVLGFVVLIFLKIMPIYMDGFKVGDVVTDMKNERNLGDKSNREIQTMILKRLDINMVTDVKPDDIYIQKGKNIVKIDVEYEVRKNLFGNLDVIVSFKKSVEAPDI